MGKMRGENIGRTWQRNVCLGRLKNEQHIRILRTENLSENTGVNLEAACCAIHDISTPNTADLLQSAKHTVLNCMAHPLCLVLADLLL